MHDDDGEQLDDGMLLLAAEECPREDFENYHVFTRYERSIIARLMAHGPVLLRGGRGSGKSALLIESYLTLKRVNSALAIPVYISLRHLPLLKSTGQEYIAHFCAILSREINRELFGQYGVSFPVTRDVGALIEALEGNSSQLGRRFVLLFDDAAHIGRERPLEEFFDIFRTISTSRVSCKASIYPGVTKFGVRFDVYNDATVIDISRDERKADFVEIFREIMRRRFSDLHSRLVGSKSLPEDSFTKLLGRAVNGNLRSFIYACNYIRDQDSLGYPDLTRCMLDLAANYFWPLLEEVAPKLGAYEILVAPSQSVAQYIFKECASRNSSYCLIHRDLIQRSPKVFEILEYAGFLSRRDASRALKSGGRGVVFSANLCNILESVTSRRLTAELAERWLSAVEEPYELHSTNSEFSKIPIPEMPAERDLSILEKQIEILGRSNAYPYGLTAHKLERLRSASLHTVKELIEASDDQILSIHQIGPKSLKNIRNVVYQAVWM